MGLRHWMAVGSALVTLSGSAPLGLHMLRIHDAGIRSEDALREQAAVDAVNADAAARLKRLTTIKDRTHAAPVTTGCVDSPAVSSLLDGLRGQPTNTRPR